jgi:hypothetical protein
MLTTIATLFDHSSAPPMPWRNRNPISTGRLSAEPQNSELTVGGQLITGRHAMTIQIFCLGDQIFDPCPGRRPYAIRGHDISGGLGRIDRVHLFRRGQDFFRRRRPGRADTFERVVSPTSSCRTRSSRRGCQDGRSTSSGSLRLPRRRHPLLTVAREKLWNAFTAHLKPVAGQNQGRI